MVLPGGGRVKIAARIFPFDNLRNFDQSFARRRNSSPDIRVAPGCAVWPVLREVKPFSLGPADGQL